MFNREEVWLYVVLTFIAAWGGVVSYFRKVSNGAKHTFWRFAGEVCTSAFAGLAVGALLLDSGASPVWSAACAGVAGHMGGKAMDTLEDIVREVLYTAARIDRRRGAADARGDKDDRRAAEEESTEGRKPD